MKKKSIPTNVLYNLQVPFLLNVHINAILPFGELSGPPFIEHIKFSKLPRLPPGPRCPMPVNIASS